MSCWETIADYAFRSIGYGERLLPRSDFTLCQHFTLIGSGMIWNIYFGLLALKRRLLLGHCGRSRIPLGGLVQRLHLANLEYLYAQMTNGRR